MTVFVEALVLLVTYQSRAGSGPRVPSAWDQIRDVVADRHPESKRWDDEQLDRLKAKCITWCGRAGPPPKVAVRVELLAETRKGCRAGGERAGTPSEFALVGLVDLLAEADRPRRREPPGDP